jgi:hypothetical protein
MSRIGGIAFELSPQPVDLHIDAAFVAGRPAIRERVARDDLPVRVGEKAQHLAFAFDESDAFVAPVQGRMGKFEAEVAEAHHKVLRNDDLAIFAPAQQ